MLTSFGPRDFVCTIPADFFTLKILNCFSKQGCLAFNRSNGYKHSAYRVFKFRHGLLLSLLGYKPKELNLF